MREFLPERRKREARGRAELFPRGERGVVTYGDCGLRSAERGMRSAERGVAERRAVKRELREMVSGGVRRET